MRQHFPHPDTIYKPIVIICKNHYHYMKKTITFLLATFFTITSFGQSFEGKIVYQNTYKSKIPNVSDEQLQSLMGSTQEYLIKQGNYKSITNGSSMLGQLYINPDNKLYNKIANSEALLWNDAATNPDEVLEATVSEGETEILGYRCKELILKCKSGTQKYYFSSLLPVDARLYINHKFGNWYEFISRSNSLPLKAVIDNAQLELESIATEVKPMNLDPAIFELPANSKTVKSPY